MIRSFARRVLDFVASGMARMPGGQKLVERLIAARMQSVVSVSHNAQTMHFVAPNALTRYRADSFSSKEPDTLNWLETIPDGAVLWDVGANVGLYSIYAAKKCHARVFSFEPSVFNLELLARNIFLNGLQENVTIIPVALSDDIGPSLFKMSSTNWGGALSTFGRDIDQHGGKLNSVFEYKTMGLAMDDFVKLLGVPAPQFIKIDVDGIEHFILRGGVETLMAVESVLIEIDDDFAEQAEETARRLDAAGLVLHSKRHMVGGQHNQWWIRADGDSALIHKSEM